MKNRITATLTIAAMLSACTQLSTPPQTLDQKLHQAQTPDERREVLRLACLNEADYTTRLKKSAYQKKYGSKRLASVKDTEETKKLKSLCREMTSYYEAVQQHTSTYENSAALAKKCTSYINSDGDKQDKARIQHRLRMAEICTEMTGKHVVCK